jgi:hypothetical protein
MRLTNSVQKIALEDKLSKLRPLLDVSIRDAGFDPADYADVQGLIDSLPSMLNTVNDGATDRFAKVYRLWASVPKEDNKDHWMYPLCSATDTHLSKTLDELYGREDYKSMVLEHIEDFLSMIVKHLTLFHEPDLGYIIYTQVSASGDGLLARTALIHPYFGSPTLHEFFKLMLEWQWAKYHADNDEPVAHLADRLLTHFGLHVDETDSNKVVKDLMALPDQQIAQYFKTGTCIANADEPEMPMSFRLWAAENGLMEQPRPLLAQLYKDCVSYKNTENDLARL